MHILDAGFYVSEVPADGSDDFAYDENENKLKDHLYDREAYHDTKLEDATYTNGEDKPKDYIPC